MQFVVRVGSRVHEPSGSVGTTDRSLGGRWADSTWPGSPSPESGGRQLGTARPIQPHTLERAGFGEGELYPSKAVVSESKFQKTECQHEASSSGRKCRERFFESETKEAL